METSESKKKNKETSLKKKKINADREGKFQEIEKLCHDEKHLAVKNISIQLTSMSKWWLEKPLKVVHTIIKMTPVLAHVNVFFDCNAYEKHAFTLVEAKCEICLKTVFRVLEFNGDGKLQRYGAYTRKLDNLITLNIDIDLSMKEVSEMNDRINMKKYHVYTNSC